MHKLIIYKPFLFTPFMEKYICKQCCSRYFQGNPEDRISDSKIDLLWDQNILPCFYNSKISQNSILPRKISFNVEWISNSEIPTGCMHSLEQFYEGNKSYPVV